MSWKDRRANTVFTITTGDGKVFTPLWMSGETSKEFNATVFEMIGIDGAKVERKHVGPRSFPLVFWFQGDDNIEQAEAFDTSANDSRAWTVRHPYYGDVTGQPMKIGRNDNNINVTEFNVDFLESIIDTVPKQSVSAVDAADVQFTAFATISPTEYAAKTQLTPADQVTVTDLATKINNLVGKVLTSVNYAEFNEAMSLAFYQVSNLLLAPVAAIQALQNVMALPAKFDLAVTIRLNLLQTILDSFLTTLTLKPTRNNKALFEAGGGGVLAAMNLMLLNPAAGDYKTRAMIATDAAKVTAQYQRYLQVLNDAYVSSGNTGSSFTAGYQTQQALQVNMISTAAGLATLVFNARQERVVTLEKDSNLILLTHKYMGLDAFDANLEEFRTINNIKNKQLLLIKKGRQIRYYV